jgi:hypothetical protein
VFTSLALSSLEQNKNDTELAKVVANELFYYSFICPGNPVPNAPPNDPMMWMPYLRTEASYQVTVFNWHLIIVSSLVCVNFILKHMLGLSTPLDKLFLP